MAHYYRSSKVENQDVVILHLHRINFFISNLLAMLEVTLKDAEVQMNIVSSLCESRNVISSSPA